MSHKVLPLDASGYGRLVGETAKGAMALHRRIASGDWAPFKLVPLPASDLNIVCFAVGHPLLETLERTNDFMDRIYRALSVGPDTLKRPDYYVTKTVLRADEYGRAALPTVEGLGFTSRDYERAGGVDRAALHGDGPLPGLTSGKGGLHPRLRPDAGRGDARGDGVVSPGLSPSPSRTSGASSRP
jgi:hypothetical protein